MMKRLVCWGVACGVMLASGSASAQDETYDPLDAGNGILSTTSYGGTSSSTTLTTVGVIFLVSGGMRAEIMRQYLKENEAAAQASLRTGTGEASMDLAQLFGVSTANAARFGQLLRAERAALLAEVPAGGPTGEQAGRFIALVIEGMRADEALGADVAYWEARRVAQE
jgi:hypothetical protein